MAFHYDDNVDYNMFNTISCFRILFENCTFENIVAIGELIHGDVIFDNCLYLY